MKTNDIGLQCVEMLRGRMALPDANGYARNASGRTAKSFAYDASSERLVVFADGEHAPIATLQYGSGAGARGGWFYGVIEQWIRDKGLNATPKPYIRQASDNWQPKYTAEERGIKAMAGAIATMIMQRGTKRYENNSKDLYTPVQEFAIAEMTKHYINYYVDELLK